MWRSASAIYFKVNTAHIRPIAPTLTMGKSTVVGANWAPHSSISFAHLKWSSRPLAEMPMTLVLRFAKSGALFRGAVSEGRVADYRRSSVPASHFCQLRRADWCEVAGVREQDGL